MNGGNKNTQKYTNSDLPRLEDQRSLQGNIF